MTEIDSNTLTSVRPNDEQHLRETLNTKCDQLSEIPGLMLEFDPEEAEQAGAFREDALSEDDALDSVFDEHPYGDLLEHSKLAKLKFGKEYAMVENKMVGKARQGVAEEIRTEKPCKIIRTLP